MDQNKIKESMGLTGEQKYYRKWYELNKEELSTRRALRYKNDPEFRRKNAERKNKLRAKEKKQREELKEEILGTFINLLEEDGMSRGVIARAISYFPHGARGYPRVQEIQGTFHVVYPMGYLCVRLARHGQTLRLWHDNEVLPPATFVDEQGWRWYSWEYIQACAVAARKVRESGTWTLKKFKAALEE